MRTIWKFTLQVTDEQWITLPAGAKLLSVQVQRGEPQLWALVDPAALPEPRRIRTHGTGHPVNHDPVDFIGTYQLQGGELVFHVFMDRGGK